MHVAHLPSTPKTRCAPPQAPTPPTQYIEVLIVVVYVAVLLDSTCKKQPAVFMMKTFIPGITIPHGIKTPHGILHQKQAQIPLKRYTICAL